MSNVTTPTWLQEHAWQCEDHRWNTCPLTFSALRFSVAPCCERAVILVSRQRSVPEPAAR